MKLIEQNFFFQVYTDNFEGHEVIWRRNVFTHELTLQLPLNDMYFYDV